MLERFDKVYPDFLWGKNYFADFLSFIPAEALPFRQEWSYGWFSTKTLFGWENHFGLRGGWFFQPYINFGYFGVLLAAVFGAIMYSQLEIFPYRLRLLDHKLVRFFPMDQFFIAFTQVLTLKIFISSAFFDVYLYGLILAILLFSSLALQRGRFKFYNES